MRKARPIAYALALMLGAAAPAAWAHGDDDSPQTRKSEKLGDVNFAVSCNAAAQKEFNRAMALFHSFWFDQAKVSFKGRIHDVRRRGNAIFAAIRRGEGHECLAQKANLTQQGLFRFYRATLSGLPILIFVRVGSTPYCLETPENPSPML